MNNKSSLKKRSLLQTIFLVIFMICEDEDGSGSSINIWGIDYPIETT